MSDSFPEMVKQALRHWGQFVANLPNQSIALFAPQHDHIALAVRYGLQFKSTQTLAWQLALDVFPLIEGWGQQWETWLSVFGRVNEPTMSLVTPLRAQLLNRSGQLCRLSGRVETAIEQHLQALTLAEQTNDLLLKLSVAYQLCADYRVRQNKAEARRYLGVAQALVERVPAGDTWTAQLTYTEALLTQREGHYEQALTLFQQALAHWQALEQPIEQGRTLSEIATTLALQGHYESALATYKKAEKQMETAQAEVESARIRYQIGWLYVQQHQYQLANLHIEQARRRLYQLPFAPPRLVAVIHHGLGYTLLHKDRLTDATLYLRQATDYWKGLDDTLNLANTTATIGEVYKAQGNFQRALTTYEDALTLLNGKQGSRANRLREEFANTQTTLHKLVRSKMETASSATSPSN